MYVFECSHCTGCHYNRYYDGKGSTFMTACHYLLDTGKMRGCSVEACNRRIPMDSSKLPATFNHSRIVRA